MTRTVQARLDPETSEALEQLVRNLGWSRAKIVREGIRLLAERNGVAIRRRRLIGVGMFSSGVSDLATNPKYMEDFGRKKLPPR